MALSSLKKKNIIITGGSGFIGSNFLSLKDYYEKKNYKIYAPTHKELDILNISQLKTIVSNLYPQVIINFAAFRNATLAEEQRGDVKGSVWKTNVLGVKNLSKVCKKNKTFLIHISTDMVFSGSRDNPGPYDEETKPETSKENLSWYGWTKSEGEHILMNNKNTAIIRIGNVTQPVYDPKLDYVGKIIYLFDRGNLYPLFNDQYLTLTSIPSIFQVIEKLINNRFNGVFHVASENIFTPHKLGIYLLEKTRGKGGIVKSVSINKYLEKWPNRYPKYGGLLAKKTAKKLDIDLLNWEEIVDIYIRELGFFK